MKLNLSLFLLAIAATKNFKFAGADGSLRGRDSVERNRRNKKLEGKTKEKLNRYLLETEVEAFKKQHFVKKEAQLTKEFISSSNATVSVNGRTYNLDGALEEYSVRAPGFISTVDGEDATSSTMLRSNLWTGTIDGDSIFLSKDVDSNVEFVHIVQHGQQQDCAGEPAQKQFTMLPFPSEKGRPDGTMAIIKQEDYDEEALNKMFNYDNVDDEEELEVDPVEEKDTGGGKEPVQIASTNWQSGKSNITKSSSNDSDKFKLNTKARCTSFRTAEIAIAYDSSFCAHYGRSGARAQARVEAIVGRASRSYEVSGLCITLKISRIEGHCNRATDPYRNIVNRNDLLGQFQRYWNRNRKSVRRDTAHLFSGTDFDRNGNTIGKAFRGSMCRLSAAYGINWMTNRGGSLSYQSDLFAHELGHNAGAPHVTKGTGYIMAQSSDGRKGFSSTSIRNMNRYLSGQNCLSRSTGGGSSKKEFYIINPATNKALDVKFSRCDDGTNIHLWSFNGSGAQKFRFGSNGSIINVKCNKAIDVSRGSCTRGTNLQLWRINGTGAQSFKVDSDGTIRNTKCNQAIDIHNNWSRDGTNIKIWPKNGYGAQQWRIRYV